MRTADLFRRTLAGMAACFFVLAVGAADGQWWKQEPIRFLQTNLSENDSTVDPRTLVGAVADFGANTFLMNMGGICLLYTSPSPRDS